MDDNRKPERRLVTDFAELKVGMKIVISPCGWCGREEHNFLVAFSPSISAVDSHGSIMTEPGFEEATVGCLARRGAIKSFITPTVVADGIVFCIIDGLDKDQDEFERKLDEIAASMNAQIAKPIRELHELVDGLLIRTTDPRELDHLAERKLRNR